MATETAATDVAATAVLGTARRPWTMERVARMQPLALAAAMVCAHCHVVGELTGTDRCPGCGRKRTMVRLLERATLEVLLTMADPEAVAQPLPVPVLVRTKAVTREELMRLVVKCGGNIGEAARLAGVHRNTVTRYVGTKRTWAATSTGIAAVGEAVVVEKGQVAA